MVVAFKAQLVTWLWTWLHVEDSTCEEPSTAALRQGRGASAGQDTSRRHVFDIKRFGMTAEQRRASTQWTVRPSTQRNGLLLGN